jgi:hypothetical protein
LYTKSIPLKNLYGAPKNVTVHFNLYEREVIKLIPKFKALFEWQESVSQEDLRNLDPVEVIEYFNIVEEVLLESYGTPAKDGMSFDKSDRYIFEDSVTFNAVMMMFLTDPEEIGRFLDGVMPKDMLEMVKQAEGSLEKLEAMTENEELKAEIARLRAEASQNVSAIES